MSSQDNSKNDNSTSPQGSRRKVKRVGAKDGLGTSSRGNGTEVKQAIDPTAPSEQHQPVADGVLSPRGALTDSFLVINANPSLMMLELSPAFSVEPILDDDNELVSFNLRLDAEDFIVVEHPIIGFVGELAVPVCIGTGTDLWNSRFGAVLNKAGINQSITTRTGELFDAASGDENQSALLQFRQWAWQIMMDSEANNDMPSEESVARFKSLVSDSLVASSIDMLAARREAKFKTMLDEAKARDSKSMAEESLAMMNSLEKELNELH